MNKAQKAHIQFGINWATTHMQKIEVGPESRYDKADQMEWQLVMMLDNVVTALPKAMRAQAQACIDTHKRLRAAMMADIEADMAAWEAQKEASSESLQTAS